MPETGANKKVEVISSVRRRWRTAEKLSMVEESDEPAAAVSEVAR